jgi:hypothetical protein
MKRMSYRIGITVTREMRVALEVLAARTGLAVTTQAMVLLRQALDRTMASDAVQIRLKQERAFRTREDWLLDQQTETYVERAASAAEGDDPDAPPR